MDPRQPVINEMGELSPISQLATGMIQNTVLQGPLSGSSFSQGVHHDRLKQLQPPKQQYTPPFNLSELNLNPLNSFHADIHRWLCV